MADLVVPKGPQLARDPFETGLEIESASRHIDHVQHRSEKVLEKARRASMDMGALARTRETC